MKIKFNFSKIMFWVLGLILVAGGIFYFVRNHFDFYNKNEESPSDSVKISVVVPVYNTEKYLDECLTSLVNQTLKEIEIICINDGSTDSSLEILNSYKNKDSRIKIIDQKNQGVCAARNAGIRAAQGAYISFVDSDDYMETITYEMCYNHIKKYNPDVIGIENYQFEDGHPETIKKEAYNANNIKVYGDGKSTVGYPEKELDVDTSNCIWNKIIKRSFILDNNLFFKGNITNGEDSLYNYLMFLRAKKVVSDKNKLYYYRTQRSGSAMSIATSKKHLDSRVSIAHYLVEDYNNFDYIKGHEKWMLNLILDLTYGLITERLELESEKISYASKLLDVIDEPFLKKAGVSDERISELRKLASRNK